MGTDPTGCTEPSRLNQTASEFLPFPSNAQVRTEGGSTQSPRGALSPRQPAEDSQLSLPHADWSPHSALRLARRRLALSPSPPGAGPTAQQRGGGRVLSRFSMVSRKKFSFHYT